MFSGDSNDNQSNHRRPWWRIFGFILMLPIGIIIALVLIFAINGNSGNPPGHLLLILLAIFLVLFIVRMIFWSSRRRHWRQQLEKNRPIRILRERYARGEITKEQFDQMLQDIRRSRL
jgi:putative membrane protein